MLKNVRVLVVDDLPELVKATGRVLRRAGAVVESCATVDDALPLLAWAQLVVTDFSLESETSARLIQAARELQIPVVVVTGGDTRRVTNAVGPCCVVAKPFDADTLLSAVAEVMS